MWCYCDQYKTQKTFKFINIHIINNYLVQIWKLQKNHLLIVHKVPIIISLVEMHLYP